MNIMKEGTAPGSKPRSDEIKNLVITNFPDVPTRQNHHFSKERFGKLFLAPIAIVIIFV